MDYKVIAKTLAEKQAANMTNEDVANYLNVHIEDVTVYHRNLVIDLIELEKLDALSEVSNQIKVDINYYTDDNGDKIYDEDSMRNSFESQLTNLKNN